MRVSRRIYAPGRIDYKMPRSSCICFVAFILVTAAGKSDNGDDHKQDAFNHDHGNRVKAFCCSGSPPLGIEFETSYVLGSGPAQNQINDETEKAGSVRVLAEFSGWQPSEPYRP